MSKVPVIETFWSGRKTNMTLSNYRKELSNFGLENTESLFGAAKFYTEEDVKDFIKELKDRLCFCELSHRMKDGKRHDIDCTCNTIDELAGDKLI